MTAISESELRTMLRYEDITVDGMWLGANACRDCLKPFVPEGVPIPNDETHRYCWRTHESDALLCELEDLRAQRDAVLALHPRTPDGHGGYCGGCQSLSEYWPCPTVQALT